MSLNSLIMFLSDQLSPNPCRISRERFPETTSLVCILELPHYTLCVETGYFEVCRSFLKLLQTYLIFFSNRLQPILVTHHSWPSICFDARSVVPWVEIAPLNNVSVQQSVRSVIRLASDTEGLFPLSAGRRNAVLLNMCLSNVHIKYSFPSAECIKFKLLIIKYCIFVLVTKPSNTEENSIIHTRQ